MKLVSKLTLYNTISRSVIILLFIWLLPLLIQNVSLAYTNNTLKEQQKKVLDNIEKNGIDYYFQGDSTYGSYTMLKDEFISLEKIGSRPSVDTIETSQRVIETDTLNYRLLIHTFQYKDQAYLLEIGKTVSAIEQFAKPLQRISLSVLIVLILVTIIIDLVSTRLLLKPFQEIIQSKLHDRKFPFRDKATLVKTSTTDFRYLDESLVNLMERIRLAFEKEREFTSNASHELMTPISILQTKMENMMIVGELTEDSQDKISGMMATLERLKRIVRSLLFISRIENDQFEKTEVVNLQVLLKDVTEELRDRIEARGIDVRIMTSGKELKKVNRDLLFQLFYNIINNAIRYNRENGSIIISESFTKETYAIHVKDSGEGIAEEDQVAIFDRFKKSGNKTSEGYGLGLSIVQTIALYHEAVVTVQSKKGEGSTFTVSFSV